AVAGFGVRKRPQLVERVQVRPGHAEGLAFVQVPAPPAMPVREGEERIGPRKCLEVERGLAHRPGLAHEVGVLDHALPRSSARSVTTTSAPCSRRASAWPTRAL